MLKFLTIATLVSHALVAGTFFAFSTFIMSALGKGEPSQAIRAMQSINSTILSSPFMVAFGASTLLSIALPFVAKFSGERSWSPYLIVVLVLSVVGVFLVTTAGNVPLNNQLDAVKAPYTASQWDDYARSWLVWNHIRTAAGVVAIACLSLFLSK